MTWFREKQQYIENVDTYYDCEQGILEKYRINVRRRVSNGDGRMDGKKGH